TETERSKGGQGRSRASRASPRAITEFMPHVKDSEDTLCMASETSVPVAAPANTGASLRPNAVGLLGVLFQSVTLMGPGVAVAFAFGPGITYAGGSFPLALVLALVGCLLLASNIGQMALHLPSAGGMYTYISRGLGRSVGFLAGWIT